MLGGGSPPTQTIGPGGGEYDHSALAFSLPKPALDHDFCAGTHTREVGSPLAGRRKKLTAIPTFGAPKGFLVGMVNSTRILHISLNTDHWRGLHTWLWELISDASSGGQIYFVSLQTLGSFWRLQAERISALLPYMSLETDYCV